MAEQILYSLKIEGTQTELERLAALNDEINKGKENLKELAKTDKQAAEQQKLTLKEQQSEYRELQKSIERRNKAEEQGINTLEKMRAKLTLLYKELDSTEVGSKRFKEITIEANKLRNEIGKAEEASGRFQRNVGNYQNAIQDAFKGMGVNVAGLTENLASANSVIQLVTASTKGMTAATGKLNGALRVLKVALISTGVGALVVALGAAITLLVNALKSFDPLIDKIEQGVAALKAVFGSLSDTILSVVTGQKSLKDAANGAGDAMRRSAAAAIEYKKAQQDLDDAVFKATVTQEKYKNQIAELLLQSKNRTLSERERIELIDRALEIEQKAFNERKAIADQELSIAQGAIITKNNLTDEEIDNIKRLGVEYAIELKERKSVTDEQIQALADAQAKQLQLEGESISLREKALNRRDQLEDEANEKALKRAEEQRAIEIKNAAKLVEDLKKKAEVIEKEYNEENLRLKRDFAEKIITKHKYDDTVITLEAAKYQELKALYDTYNADFDEKEIAYFQKVYDEQIKRNEIEYNLEQKRLNDLKALRSDARQREIESDREIYEQKIKFEEDLSAIREEYQTAQIDLAFATSDILKSAFSETSDVQKSLIIFQKALAVADVLIQAAKAKAALAANIALIPAIIPPGIPNPFYIAALGINAAKRTALNLSTAASLAGIAASAIPEFKKFARGVIGLEGAGTATSDSIDAKLSRGESVMTAKATKVFAPVLAQMEQAVGNTPNVQIGSGRFANGIIGLSPRTDFPQNYEQIIKRTIEAVGDIPVVVAESDITGTQNKVRRIKVAGDL